MVESHKLQQHATMAADRVAHLKFQQFQMREMVVTRAQKSVIVGYRIQGADDDQSDKNGTDN
jgi:hypothetical protein